MRKKRLYLFAFALLGLTLIGVGLIRVDRMKKGGLKKLTLTHSNPVSKAVQCSVEMSFAAPDMEWGFETQAHDFDISLSSEHRATFLFQPNSTSERIEVRLEVNLEKNNSATAESSAGFLMRIGARFQKLGVGEDSGTISFLTDDPFANASYLSKVFAKKDLPIHGERHQAIEYKSKLQSFKRGTFLWGTVRDCITFN